jgi:2-methylcitrate dehydratase PrpD
MDEAVSCWIGCRSGMIAAQLAQKGFRGPTSIIKGRDGFLYVYSSGADPGGVLEGIGSWFGIVRTSVKPDACWGYMQPPIDAVLKIVKENDLQPDQVKKIRFGLLRAGAHLIADPIESKYSPQSIVDSKFSMAFWCCCCTSLPKSGPK